MRERLAWHVRYWRLAGSAVIFSLLAPAFPAIVAPLACEPVVVGEFGNAVRGEGTVALRPEVSIEDAGTYCLEENVQQRKLVDPIDHSEIVAPGGDGIVLIGAHDVLLDLRGRVVSNERRHGYTLVKHYSYDPGRRQRYWYLRTHVRNGILRSPGRMGIGLRLISADMYGPKGFGTVASVPPGKCLADVFTETSHVIEGLTIEAGRRAILIDGRNNVIRNNRIAVDGTTAIIAQGPGTVIENNIIEVRNDLEIISDHERQTEAKTPFPIRLIQADGAIIRNNEIRLSNRDSTMRLPAAIELVQSANVTIECNRIVGITVSVLADPSSSYRDRAGGSEAGPCS